jgi:hypothetical protein
MKIEVKNDCRIDGVGVFHKGQVVEGEQAEKIVNSASWEQNFIKVETKPRGKK